MAFAVIVWTQSIVSPQWKQLNPLGKYTHERSLIDADQLISQISQLGTKSVCVCPAGQGHAQKSVFIGKNGNAF